MMATLCPLVLRTCQRCRNHRLFSSVLNAGKRPATMPSLTLASTTAPSTRLLPTSAFSSSTRLRQTQTSGEDEDLLAGFEVSHDEFKYVEPLLPVETVPEIPERDSYPTPSGWFPPDEKVRSQYPYMVCRTKNGLLPLYTKTERLYKNAYNTVKITKIEGDIWALEADLRTFLEEQLGTKVIMQVHEVSRHIRVRGMHTELVGNFLLERGN